MITAITTPLVTHSGVNDIFIADNQYALVATFSGLDVIDLFTQEVISSGTFPSEPLCVVADTSIPSFTKAYVGTSGNGIYSIEFVTLRSIGSDFTGSLQQRFSTASIPPITDNEVKDLAAVSGRLLVSTASGVDFITNENLRAFRTVNSGSDSCQLTAAGEAYWTVVNSGIETNYDLFPASGTGIITVDFEYNNSSSDPILPSNIVNDIAIVPNSPNLLGFATPAGGLIIEESQGSEASALRKTILSGTEEVVSLDFSKQATFIDGTVYVATTGSLQVFGLVDDTISGTHFHTIAANDFETENTRGQALVTGTVSIVRTTNIS